MKIHLSIIALATTFMFAINNPSQAHNHTNSNKVGDLVISNTWARVTPKTAKTGAAFFSVKNRGKTNDTLVGVSSEIAKKTEIHQSSIKNNVMKMRYVGKVGLPAEGVTELKPGSFHIMFIGLYAPIKEGNFFYLTLTFKKAGTVRIRVTASTVSETSYIDHSKMKTN
jgi:copper(I)-binding protein